MEEAIRPINEIFEDILRRLNVLEKSNINSRRDIRDLKSDVLNNKVLINEIEKRIKDNKVLVKEVERLNKRLDETGIGKIENKNWFRKIVEKLAEGD